MTIANYNSFFTKFTYDFFYSMNNGDSIDGDSTNIHKCKC